MICWSIRRSADWRRRSALRLSGSLLRNSVSRRSPSMSLSLTTCLPTITAMRSTTTASPQAAVHAKRRSRLRISESLSDREKELDVAHALLRALAEAGQSRCGQVWIALEQLYGRAAEAQERGRV